MMIFHPSHSSPLIWSPSIAFPLNFLRTACEYFAHNANKFPFRRGRVLFSQSYPTPPSFCHALKIGFRSLTRRVVFFIHTP